MFSSKPETTLAAYRDAINEKFAQWMATQQQTSPQTFRFMFTLIYIGITGIIAYFNELWRNESHFLFGRNVELGLLLLLLLALERFEHIRFRDRTPAPIAAGFLFARMVLFEGVVALDSSMVSLFLYPIVPFSTYFSFGSNVSNILSLFYLIMAGWRTWQLDNTWYMDAGVMSTLVAFVFVLIFMQVVAPFIKRDEENRRRTGTLLADLQTSHLKLQLYAAQVAELAASEERNRLARDIHDSLGHYLTIVNIQLEKALVYWERDAEQATQAIRDAKHAAAEALQDVRSSVSTLRDVDKHFDLEQALGELIKHTGSTTLKIELNVSGEQTGYSRSALMALYRAGQEGLTNAQKHAQASMVHIDVQFGDHLAQLVVRDNGKGFDPKQLEQDPETDTGFGLQGIRERIELISGQMSLQSKPQAGTELKVTVPQSPTKLVGDEWFDLQITQRRGS